MAKVQDIKVNVGVDYTHLQELIRRIKLVDCVSLSQEIFKDEVQEEKNMTTKIEWEVEPAKKVLYFRDLSVNATFRIDSANAHGAVYRKVQTKDDYSIPPAKQYMMEEQTGVLFNPTASPVALVESKVVIKAHKPKIYG